MKRSTRFTIYLGSISAAAFALSLTTLSAGQGGQAPAPAPGTPPKPLVPVAASSVVKNPDPYIGEYVTLTATVESNLTKTAFSVDQDKTKSTGQDVLVLAPNLQKPADANAYVTVIGQLIKFDPAEVAKNLKGYTIDLSPADLEKYNGKPVVLATAVINSGGVDHVGQIGDPARRLRQALRHGRGGERDDQRSYKWRLHGPANSSRIHYNVTVQEFSK